MKKCIAYVLSSNIPEIIPFLLFIACKIPLSIEIICILLIDLGTDLAPAISLAYEEPEENIMQRPPRGENAHLVGLQMMIVAYGTIGVLQTIAAYVAWYYCLAEWGFSFNSLFNAGMDWRTPYHELSDARATFFTNLCMNNAKYLLTGGNCQEDFVSYREKALAEADAAFLLTVVWSQIANILIRKTQTLSIFSKIRMLGNQVLIWSIAAEILIICGLVYIPGLNTVFLLDYCRPYIAASGVWIIPLLIIWDEVRKFFCRKNPEGFLNKYTNF